MIRIEKAIFEDSKLLTHIAFEGKKHWNYPNEYIQIWQSELTITETYIQKNIVYKAFWDEQIVGFYSIVELKEEFFSDNIKIKKGWWLDHLFILPKYHHKQIGSTLINHSKSILAKMGVDEYLIFADPNSAIFYEKMGARFLYNSPSSINNREIPVYKLLLN